MVDYETASRFSEGFIAETTCDKPPRALPTICPPTPVKPTPIWPPWSMPGPTCPSDQGRHRGDGQGRIEVISFSPAAVGPGGAALAIFLSGPLQGSHEPCRRQEEVAVRFQLSLTSIVVPKPP